MCQPRVPGLVVRQVRAESDCEILLMSGAISFPDDLDTMFPNLPEAERRKRIDRIKDYRPGLGRVARQEKCELLDMRAFWDAYEQSTRMHPMWLRRDVVHANARGRQVVARVLEAYFAPEK